MDAGAVILTDDQGDPAIESDDKCSYTKWNTSTTAWLKVPVISRLHDGACPNLDGTGGGTIETRVEQQYDAGAGLTRGLLTDTWTWTTPDGDRATGVDVIHSATEYDAYGRPTKITGPRDDEGMALITTTDYNPGAGAAGDKLPVTGARVVQVNAMTTARTTPASPSTPTRDIVTSTELDPGRGLPTTMTDANGAVTLITYNALGQTTQVRYPGQDANEDASAVYSYTTSAGDPSRVKVSMLRDVTPSGTAVYDDTYTFYDGWGRAIQTQSPQPNAPTKRYVAATGYDEQGQTRYTIPDFKPAADTGFADIVNPDLGALPRYTVTGYDAAARPLTLTDKSYTSTVATTSTEYRGDATVTTPAEGGRTLTRSDRWDRPTRVIQYAGLTLGTADIVDAANYTYTARGELETVFKTLPSADGSPVRYDWSYGYDLTGRQIWAHDPDTGITATEYDDAGNPTSITTGPIARLADALDTSDPDHPVVADPTAVITTTYDVLDRPLVMTDETNPNDTSTITTWGYDAETVPNSIGRGTSVDHPITGFDEFVLNGPNGTYEADVLGYDAMGNATSSSETYPVWLTGEAEDNNLAHPANTYTRTTASRYTEGNLLEAVDYPAIPGLPAATINYQYTVGARLRAMTLGGSGQSVRVAQTRYNEIGQTTGLTSGTYDSTNLTTGTLLTGLDRGYTWEEATGRFKTITDTITPATSSGAAGSPFTAFSLDYTYDKVGNPRLIKGTVADQAGATGSTGYWCYDYDGLNRLTDAATGTTHTSSGIDYTCATPNGTDATPVTGEAYDLSYEHNADRLTAVVDNLHTTGGSDGEPLRVDYETRDANTDGPDQGTVGDGQRPHHNTNLTTQLSIIELLDWPNEMPAPGTIHNDDQGRIDSWRPDIALLELLDQPIIGDQGPHSTGYNYEYNRLGQLEHTQATELPPLVPNITSSSAWYAYRPDGTRFVRARNFVGLGVQRETTVYLADGSEITHTTVVNKTESVRTFTTPNGTPVATQAYDSSTDNPFIANRDAHWTWLAADAQKSVRLTYAHNPTGRGALERAHYYPYGDPTTTGPPETPNDAGYLNKHHDITGDIRLDHRNYTPNLNILTTPDPILIGGDPQSFNPYTYARNNPIKLGDPSGLYPCDPNATRCLGPDPDAPRNWAPDTSGSSDTSDLANTQIYEVTDLDGVPGGQGRFCLLGGGCLEETVEMAICETDSHVMCIASGDAIASPGLTLAQGFKLFVFDPSACSEGPIQCMIEVVLAAPSPLKAAKLLKIAEYADDARDIERVEDAISGLCSFSGRTVVLMADGTKKAIDEVEIGDKVIATDPNTGEQRAKTVEYVYVHDDIVIDLVVASEVITTTEDHPFWSVTDQRFERADELSPGEQVLGADGQQLTVSELKLGSARDALAFNLSVQGIHTFHVGEAGILVHNNNTCGWNAGTALPSGEKAGVVGNRIWGHGTPSYDRLDGLTPDELRGLATREDAVQLRDWYAAADVGEKGGDTAPVRVHLANKVIEAWDTP